MKKDRQTVGWVPGRRETVLLVLAGAALAAVLALGGFFTSPAMAADFLVTETSPGVYQVDADTVVYPVEVLVETDWTVDRVAADGYTYQDAAGAFYAPDGTVNLEITISSEGYWLPVESDAQRPASADFNGGTTLTYSFDVSGMAPTGFSIDIAAPSLRAWAAPDEQGIVGASGGYYQTTDGITFSQISMVYLRIESPMVDNFAEDQLYGQGVQDGSVYGGYFLPGDITLTLNDDYVFTGALPEVSVWPEEATVQVSILDDRTISLTSADWNQITEVTLNNLQTQPAPGATVNITFEENEYFYVDVEGEKASSISWELGQDLPFSLRTRPQYSVEDWTTAVTGYMVDNILFSSDTLGPVVDSTGMGTIPGLDITQDRTVTFQYINADAFTRLVAVQDVSGPGYSLTSAEGVLPGEPGYIVLVLTVEAGYNQSTPVVTPPQGWVIDSGTPEGGDMGDGTMVYYIIMKYGDGTQPVPAAPIDLTVTVSGIVPNPTPQPPGGGGGGGGSGGGGGGGGGTVQPEIRVENELNQEGASSDTMLWPNGTTERNGVSITTVTDEELEALIGLAQQHIEDIQELEGDGYKEGIIVIEDLRPGNDIQTYILELTGNQVQRIAQEEWDRFTVQTPAGWVSLYGDTIRQVAGAGGEVTVTITRLEHEGRPGADVTLTAGGKAVTEFAEAYGVRIFVPYEPAPEEDVNALLMEYIHEDGALERVTESFYDRIAGGVYVFTGHLSKFGVAYRPAVFSDVGADHWANPYVTFLAARGLLGTGSTFRPDDRTTRGEMLELLAEALSAANLPSRAVQVYSDVSTTSSVAKAAAWAYFNNLTGSIASGSTLRPNEAITREDMAALAGNIASGVGLRLRSKGLDTGYTDLSEVASYARTAVTRLRAAGILEMPDNYKFSPDATLNRGEMARIVATLLSSL